MFAGAESGAVVHAGRSAGLPADTPLCFTTTTYLVLQFSNISLLATLSNQRNLLLQIAEALARGVYQSRH